MNTIDRWDVFNRRFELFGLPPRITVALGVGVIAALLMLHFFRQRPRKVVVAFVPLWLKAARKEQRLMGFRPRHSLALLLRLIFAVFLLGVVADPRPAPSRHGGRNLLLLIDVSARARAAQPSAPIRGAQATLENLAPADRAAIVAFADHPSLVTGFVGDAETLRSAIAEAATESLSGASANLDEALRLGAELLRGRENPAILIVGPGGYPVLGSEMRQRLTGVDTRFLRTGSTFNNVGISAFAARRRPAQPLTVDLSVHVENAGTTSVSGVVEIHVDRPEEPSLTLAKRKVTIPPGGHATIVTEVASLGASEQRIVSILKTVDGSANGETADDRSEILLPAFRAWNVLVIGRPNLYLEGALLSFDDAITFKRVAPEAMEATHASWSTFDVVIFDGVAPGTENGPPHTRFLFLGAAGPGVPYRSTGAIDSPTVTAWDREHPIARHLALEDLNIRRSFAVTRFDDAQVIASSIDRPLILASRKSAGDAGWVALLFDPRQSDLPMRPTLPLFLANSLEWLAAPRIIQASASTIPAVVDGRSSVAPAIAEDAFGTKQNPFSPPDPSAPSPFPRTPWRWLAAAGLVLLLVEWAFGARTRWS